MATLKRYVAYARATCHPCLSQAAHEMLANYYVSVREQMRKQAIESGASVIPITVRQLEAIIRISESLARMQLEAVATVDHVTEAIRLFQVREHFVHVRERATGISCTLCMVRWIRDSALKRENSFVQF